MGFNKLSFAVLSSVQRENVCYYKCLTMMMTMTEQIRRSSQKTSQTQIPAQTLRNSSGNHKDSKFRHHVTHVRIGKDRSLIFATAPESCSSFKRERSRMSAHHSFSPLTKFIEFGSASRSIPAPRHLNKARFDKGNQETKGG